MHGASLLRSIFASLTRANELVHVRNVGDFPQAKLNSEINAHLFLNKHCKVPFSIDWVSKNLIPSKKLLPKVFSYPFTRDLNITTLRRYKLERTFVNSDPRCTLLPRSTYQISSIRWCNRYLLRLFDIKAMCLATDTLKCGGIQRKKTHVMGIIARTSFDGPLTSYESLTSAVPYVFYQAFRLTSLSGTTTKNLKENLTSSDISRGTTLTRDPTCKSVFSLVNWKGRDWKKFWHLLKNQAYFILNREK